MLAKDAVGQYGEGVAVRHLEETGWEIVARNWRCSQGELDIVALDGTALVVVEVKTRRSSDFGHPAEAITREKLARLRRLTGRWVSEHDARAPEIRIDVIAITIPRAGAPVLEHLRGVS